MANALRSQRYTSNEVTGCRALLLIEYRLRHESVTIPQQITADSLL